MSSGVLIPRIPTDPPLFVAADPGLENIVAQDLGDVNLAFADFDATLATLLVELAADLPTLPLLDSLLADMSFTPGTFDSSTLLPVANDAVELQSSGESLVGSVGTPPDTGNPAASPDTFQLLSIQTLPRGKFGSAYEFTFLFIGGVPPYRFALHTTQPASTGGYIGGLPPGLTLSGDGKLTGTPTHVGHYAFELDVVDAGPDGGSWEFSLQIISGWGA